MRFADLQGVTLASGKKMHPQQAAYCPSRRDAASGKRCKTSGGRAYQINHRDKTVDRGVSSFGPACTGFDR